ncbi:MAG: hypothetical protein LM573_08300, partial [Thermofilum sp.]|nr:hypothetical protein [Thermofilum sp.]
PPGLRVHTHYCGCSIGVLQAGRSQEAYRSLTQGLKRAIDSNSLTVVPRIHDGALATEVWCHVSATYSP